MNAQLTLAAHPVPRHGIQRIKSEQSSHILFELDTDFRRYERVWWRCVGLRIWSRDTWCQEAAL